MEIKKMNVDDLFPADYNPRLDLQPEDGEYQKLKRSIEEFGYVEPIVFNEQTGYVVGGHQRLKVIKDLGIDEVDVSIVRMDEEKEKALNLALNKIEGDWDFIKLRSVIEELQFDDFDLDLTGFDEQEIEDLLNQTEDDAEVKEDDFDFDEEVDAIEYPMTETGDIWVLGKHKLLCGDSLQIDNYKTLLDGEKADLIFTDPPYNVNYEGQKGMKISNDKMEDRDFYQFLYIAFSNMLEFAKTGAPIYIFHADSEGRNFRNAMEDAGWLMKQCLIWVKNALVMGRQDYHWRHEPILYGWKKGGRHKWYGGRKQTTVLEDDEILSIQNDEGGQIITFTMGTQSVVLKVPSYEIIHRGDDEETTIWRFDKPRSNADHPTMKPIGVCARAIKNSSKVSSIVFDPFIGSGSTLIASEQLKRSCYGIEMDPTYCDAIVYRYIQFKESEDDIRLIRNGKTFTYQEVKLQS